MTGFNKSAPVQFNVDAVVATARRLAAGADAKKPMLVGADGGTQVCEPTRALPNGWTRFKAALINVPLIGRLPTIREAAQLMRATRFRDDFQAGLARKFGGDIAVAVMSPEGAPRKATLSSRKVIKVVNRAQERATAVGRENDNEFQSADPHADARANVVGRYARVLGIANDGDYFRKPLAAQARDGLNADAQTALQSMCEQSGRPTTAPTVEALPATFDAVLHGYEKRLAQASAADQPMIAAQCLRTLDELAMIVSVHPSSKGSSSSSNSAPPPPRAEDLHIVRLLCVNASRHDADQLSPAVATQSWQDLTQIQSRLHEELPSLSDDDLASVMLEITSGHTTMAPSTLYEDARKQLLIREMKRQFDPSDRDSTLWNAVIEATGKHTVDTSMTALMTSISKEMLSDLDFRVPTLQEHFACADHLPTLIDKTREQLIRNASAAAGQHVEALEFIDKTDTLTPAQKAEFKRYAEGASDTGHSRPQRLDLVQVEQLTKIANMIAQRMPLMAQARSLSTPWAGEPAVLFDSMAETGAAFQAGLGAILQHAESMWISRSFDGTDTEQRLFDLCIRLAMSRLEDSPRDLSVPGLQLPPPAAHERHYDTPVRQFLGACNQSPSMYISKLAMFFGDVARVTGHADAVADAVPLTPLSRMRPELLVRTLAHPSGSADEGGALDHRGVLTGTPGGALVAQNFHLGAILDPQRHEARLPPADAPPVALLDHFGRIYERAHVIVDGRRLIGDPDRWTESVTELYSQTFATVPKGAAIGAAIATCMTSEALPNFVADINAAAFHTPVTMANLRSAHEIWHGEDGSWYVRSTHVSVPMGQAGKTIHTDGVVLYTLTHRIEPGDGDGAPRVSLHDSNVVFAF